MVLLPQCMYINFLLVVKYYCMCNVLNIVDGEGDLQAEEPPDVFTERRR